MIEEILEQKDSVDSETYVSLQQAVALLKPTEKLVLWYWLLGFTQEETRHKIFPGRSRAHIWQVKKNALQKLKEEILRE